MTKRENAWALGLSRRSAFRALAGFFAGSPLLRSQEDPFRSHNRVPGLQELVDAFDFEAVAYAKLPRAVYDYTAYGAGSEFTLRRNRQAFDWVKLVPTATPDPSGLSTATEVLGTKMDFPILISPSAAQGDLHPAGEMAMHQGATSASNTPMIISNVASFPVEEIAQAATGPVWFQLYPKPELDANREALDKAQAAGCRAVVVTVDQQALYYERALHGRNLTASTARRTTRRAAPRNPYGIEEHRLWYEWRFFDEIRPIVKVPLLIKGILTAEDARLSIEHGLDGVYVSNHGGRSLDYGPSTLEVLPEIVEVVQGRVPVLFDSGIRRGADILKALALGASAVCLGRVPRWGLASYGAAGVQRILEIVQTELLHAMAYTGRPTLDSIDRTLVRTDFP
jgi:isopentenyl diphosphate isomerase/L-lactate dehydrogenase-like FMN-dependent dehydrogenase